MREKMTTKEYIEKYGEYWEAEAKVSMKPDAKKARITHATADFDHEPSEAEAIKEIEKDYPYISVERIDWIRDMSHKANELNEYYSRR